MTHNISSAQMDADNFYRSDAVTAEKVSFPNQYKMKVGANLFRPKEMKPAYPHLEAPQCLQMRHPS